jgi:hypothetical protein
MPDRARTRRRITASVSVGTLACWAGAPADASAQLTGATLGLRTQFPAVGTVLVDAGTAVVGAGVEFPGPLRPAALP